MFQLLTAHMMYWVKYDGHEKKIIIDRQAFST